MANSLKNLIFSPKFLSPLSPSRNLVGFSKSEGNKKFIREINRPVAKKLDFSQVSATNSVASNCRVPDIKIVEDIQNDLQQKYTKPNNANNSVLNINTPVKLDLVKNGLEKFKNSTVVLGKGNFGTVFKGRHKGETVAVKIATKECSSREKNALNVKHKNIVQTIEIIQNIDNNQTYSLIIMEYLPKCRNLQEVLENFHKIFTKENSSKLLEQFAIDITSGLDYLHKNGILHLDLKPKNILVDSENQCKICDFGNSARIDDLINFRHNGTVIYTAPEILLGKPPTVKSDIYSLGLVFWQIVYQKNPFTEYDTLESVIYNVGKYDVRPAYRTETSGVLESIFIKCWDSDPELRPNTCAILKELLNV